MEMARTKPVVSRRRLSPIWLVVLLILVIAGVLAASVLQAPRTNDAQTASGQATAGALRTQVAGLQRQVTAQQTQVARLQRRIAQVQQASATQTPTTGPNGPHSAIGLFQVATYSCILYLEWDERASILRNGRLLTADTYARDAARSFTFTGVDNNGRLSFAAKGDGLTFNFTGTRNADGSLTVTGVPWSVLYGFTGGTFRQTLHPATRQQYDAAVSNLAR